MIVIALILIHQRFCEFYEFVVGGGVSRFSNVKNNICYKMDKDDFDMMKERYIGELQNLREELQVQEQNQRILEKKANRYMDMVNHMEKYLDKREYNEALVQELVEYIEVYADGSIHVCFKCKDEFQQIAEEMEGVQIG